MKTKITALVILLCAALLTLATTSCNTAHGFGQDMEKAGEKIQDKTE